MAHLLFEAEMTPNFDNNRIGICSNVRVNVKVSNTVQSCRHCADQYECISLDDDHRASRVDHTTGYHFCQKDVFHCVDRHQKSMCLVRRNLRVYSYYVTAEGNKMSDKLKKKQ